MDDLAANGLGDGQGVGGGYQADGLDYSAWHAVSAALVLIAGGGIGGLTLALSLHQIGVPCVVFEASRQMKPLGVGINIQPHGVRELFELGIGARDLDKVGLTSQEWALVGMNGKEIYSEPRGLEAGYHWPQYAVHRGEFHMLLYKTVMDRLGAEAVQLGAKVTGYKQTKEGVVAIVAHRDGGLSEESGAVLVGADGIHSAIRAQMNPEQPPIHWGGAVMWRGTVRMKPLRTESSFVGLGTHQTRMVIYPISQPDNEGLSLVNWIAEVTMDNVDGWNHEGWFLPVDRDAFAHHFESFRYDWLDVPELLRAADCAYENPMIDRDPIPSWADGSVALMGDAAHAMYPTGSNGASQAIVDARVIAARMLDHGVTPNALAAYDAELCGPISDLVLRNRGSGPFGLLNLVDERCGGIFDEIDTVIPKNERAAFMARYQAAAGFAKEQLNAAQPTIAPGARVTL